MLFIKKYWVLIIPIFLCFLAAIPAMIVMFSKDDDQLKAERALEAKVQLEAIVDLVLQQEKLNLDLVQIGYRPEGKLQNVYGVLSLCHPQFKNTNLLQVEKNQEPIPLFKLEKSMSIISNKEILSHFFEDTACSKKGDVEIYGVFLNDRKEIKGWVMNLNKELKQLP